jgi:hypothetical protein
MGPELPFNPVGACWLLPDPDRPETAVSTLPNLVGLMGRGGQETAVSPAWGLTAVSSLMGLETAVSTLPNLMGSMGRGGQETAVLPGWAATRASSRPGPETAVSPGWGLLAAA